MHDPFPIAPPAAFATKYVQPVAEYLGLKTLPLHFHEVIFAFTLYHLTNKYFSPALSRYFFPRIYPSFNARTKLNWDVHVVSFVQSTLINTLALYVIWNDEDRSAMSWQEKVWGYTGSSGLIQGLAAGYFLWDLVITLQNVRIFGPGMLAHAVSALFVFSLGFRPFVNFYAPSFILYELSSPFLNIHWFCDKLNLTGTKIQLYNGIILLFTFFSCRLVWGTYQSIRVFSDIYRGLTQGLTDPHFSKPGTHTIAADLSPSETNVMHFAGEGGIPLWLACAYLLSNLTLNGLNWFWFSKMIQTIRTRFDPPFGTRKAKSENVVEGEKAARGEDVSVEGTHITTPGVDTLASSNDYIEAVNIEKAVEKGAKVLKVQQSEVRKRVPA